MTEDSVDIVSTALVDGFVTLCESLDEKRRRAVTARGLPIVALDAPVMDDEPFVGVDDRSAAADVARHVLDLGHRRLAVVSLHPDDGRPASLADDPGAASPRRHVSIERHRGYRDAVVAAGLDPATVPVLHGGPTGIEAGRRAVAAELRRPDRPTAILAMSDQLALGAIAEAASLGLRVPEDLSVTGYDGIAAAYDAGLTTVRQPQFDKGAAAIRLLLGGAAPGHRTVLPTELVLGRTTAAPPPRPAVPS
jgi:DNA-binding LacI/PurR family transcriptional regulator